MSPLPMYAIPGSPETALLLAERQSDGAVRLVVSPNLRASGLLHLLAPDLLRVFVALLTFPRGSGDVRASVEEIAETLRIHRDHAEALLEALSGYTFDGAPLVYPTGESDVFAFSKRVCVPVEAAMAPISDSEAPYRTVPREEVIEQSRARYAVPRAEAEAAVMNQLGIAPEEPPPPGRLGDAYRALMNAGVIEPQARQLVNEFEIERIEAQLSWLPLRGARNPGRFLVAAIRGDYDPPPGIEETGEAVSDTEGGDA